MLERVSLQNPDDYFLELGNGIAGGFTPVESMNIIHRFMHLSENITRRRACPE